MVDAEIVVAWREAAAELDVEVVAPHTLHLSDGTTVEVEAFLPDFGGPHGAVALALEDDKRCQLSTRSELFVSHLADGYRVFERRKFQKTLDDWGWYGPPARRPRWYSGRSWT